MNPTLEPMLLSAARIGFTPMSPHGAYGGRHSLIFYT